MQGNHAAGRWQHDLGMMETYCSITCVDVKSRIMGIGIPMSMKSVSYRASNTIFDVRSETYNKSGKLMGYTVLTKVY